jgi:subtilisin family serine protease
MKKIVVTLIALLSITYSSFAAGRMSGSAYMLYKQALAATDSTAKMKLRSDYALQGSVNEPTCSAIIKYNAELDKVQLRALKVIPQQDFDTIMTCILPVKKLMEISKLNGIISIAAGAKPEPTLDLALPAGNVLQVQNGAVANTKYDGTGVIVGVIDYGFDYTHPMFQDADGKLRVKRAWICDDDSGTPPEGFSFGTLYTDPDYIRNNIGYSSDGSPHGTHVLGIAAGRNTNGIGSSIGYGGVAPNADIVTVELGASGGNIADCIDYIFSYADSVDKPCVINLSLRYWTYLYLCDNNSLIDVAIRNVLNKHKKEGRIICAGAGNEGATNMHCHSVIPADGVIDVNTQQSSGSSYYKSFVALAVANEGEDFTMSVSIPDAKGVKYSTAFYSASENRTIDTMLGQSINVIITTGTDVTTDGIPTISVIYEEYTSVPVSNLYVPSFSIQSEKGADVNVWTSSPMDDGGKSDKTIDSKYLVGMPGDMEEVITLGAYTTRNQFTNIFGQNVNFSSIADINDIAYFSSNGPTYDQRIKPDITAPGMYLISAYNYGYARPQEYAPYLIDQDYKYVAMQGTSMSTPYATGVVALALQRDKNLTTEEIKELLQKTAINDDFTGQVRNNKSDVWGWGKIDALALLKEIVNGIDEPTQIREFQITPNPVIHNAALQFNLVNAADVNISVCDMLGNEMISVDGFYDAGTQIINLDVNALSTGSYICRMLIEGKQVASEKIVVK